MRLSVGLLIFGFVISGSVFAQSQSSKVKNQPRATSTLSGAEGFQASVGKSMFDLKFASQTGTSTGYRPESMSFHFGYAKIQQRQPGYTFGINSVFFQEKGLDQTTLLYMDGNLAVGLNELVFLSGGLNLSTWTNIPFATATPGIGQQIGLGLQFTSAIGAGFSYLRLTQNLKSNQPGTDFGAEAVWSGFEAQVRATF